MTLQLTTAAVRKMLPKAPQAVVNAFASAKGQADLAAVGILDNPKRLAVALAHCDAEVAGFTIKNLTENINYTAERMAKVWPNRFSSAAAVRAKYGTAAGWQKKAFDDIYGNRMGNRPRTSDGSAFIGRGGPQLTGRDGYREVGRRCGLNLEGRPELACMPVNQPAILAGFWSWKNLSPLADHGDVDATVRPWNGGTNGLAERRAAFARIYPITMRLKPNVGKVAEAVPMALFAEAEPAEPLGEAFLEPPSATVTAEIVQRRLDAMGYFPGVVGTPPGGMTAGAIAGFKNDRGIPGEPVIDNVLLAELDRAEAEGFKRPIAAARATATEEAIAPKVEAIRQNWFSRMGAKILAIPSMVGAAITGAWDALPEAKSYLDPLRDFVTDMPGWVWFALAAGVGLFLWSSTRRTGAAVLKDFQEGRRL